MNNYEIAKKYLPEVLICENEPFKPDKIGYEVFTKTAVSNTFGRRKCMVLDDNDYEFCIEYQFYFDYDITHMFDLEHVWVYVDKNGYAVNAECSFHGRCISALLPNRANIKNKQTVSVYCQPGKHAFAPNREVFETLHDAMRDCTANAGKDGLATIFYDNGKYKRTDYINKVVHESMKKYAFVPAEKYVICDLNAVELLPWQELKSKFVGIVDNLLDDLLLNRKHLVLFFDCGDTIIDEATQVFDDEKIVTSAQLIQGGDEMIKQLHELGYTMLIVADGEAQSFKNILHQHDIYNCFYSFIYSECITVQKPNARMFKAAMGAAELQSADLKRIVMLGNNLRKDVKGANNMGMTSVHINWSPRYFPVPTAADEVPDYTVSMPLEYVELVERLNSKFYESLLNK